MNPYRELGYGMMLFMSAMAGMLTGIVMFPPLHGAPVIEAVVGAVLGSAAWLSFKYLAITPRKR